MDVIIEESTMDSNPAVSISKKKYYRHKLWIWDYIPWINLTPENLGLRLNLLKLFRKLFSKLFGKLFSKLF